MAERSETVRRQGVRLRLPGVRFTASEAAARSSSQLAQSLSRMQDFFLSQTQAKAKIEGAEYGALNAPTQKQIEDAVIKNEPLNLPGDRTTIFGQAARTAALEATFDDLAYRIDAQQSLVLTGFEEDLESGTLNQKKIKDLDPLELASSLDAVTTGFASTLDEISPALARKLRAKGGLSANATWTAYAKKYENAVRQHLSEKWRLKTENEVKGLSAAISVMTPEQAVGHVNNFVTTAKNGAITHIEGQTGIKTFLDSLTTSLTGSLTDAAIKLVLDQRNDIGVVTQLEKPNMGEAPQQVQNIINALEAQGVSKEDTLLQIRTAVSARINFDEAEQNRRNLQTEKDEKAFEANALQAIGKGDQDGFSTAIEALSKTNPLRAQELKDKFDAAGRRRINSDPDVIDQFTRMGSALSFDDVAKNLNLLSNEDREKYINEARANESREFKAAIAIGRGELGIPPEIAEISTTDSNFKRVQIFNKIQGQLREKALRAEQRNEDFDAVGEMQNLLLENAQALELEVDKLERQAATKIITTINDFKIPGVNFDDDDYRAALDYLQQFEGEDAEDRPAQFRNANLSLPGLISSLEKALENE